MIGKIARGLRDHPLTRIAAVLIAIPATLVLLVFLAGRALIWHDGRLLPPRTPSLEVIEDLTRDFHFRIGGRSLVAPVLAVSQLTDHNWLTGPANWTSKDRAKPSRLQFYPAAARAETAPEFESLMFRLSYYSSAEWRPNPLVALCPPIRAEWARRLCAGQLPGLELGLVTLATVSALRADKRLMMSPEPPEAAEFQTRTFREGELSTTCWERHCLAVLPLPRDLVFLWRSGREEGGIEAVAQVLAGFADHALGAVENFPALQAALCRAGTARRGGTDCDLPLK